MRFSNNFEWVFSPVWCLLGNRVPKLIHEFFFYLINNRTIETHYTSWHFEQKNTNSSLDFEVHEYYSFMQISWKPTIVGYSWVFHAPQIHDYLIAISNLIFLVLFLKIHLPFYFSVKKTSNFTFEPFRYYNSRKVT